MWPGPRPTAVTSGILIRPALWLQQTWTENWGLCPYGGSWLPIQQCRLGRGMGIHVTQCRLGLKAYTSVVSGIFVHPTVWSQRACAENGGLCFRFGRGDGGGVPI